MNLLTKNEIEFVETVPSFGASGALRARLGYGFRLPNAKDVVVWVNDDSILLLKGGQLSPDEVKLAARTLIELEHEKGVDLNQVEELELNYGAMYPVSQRLGWSDRFRKSM